MAYADWDATDKVLYGVALSSLYIDYRQTLEIVEDPNYYETNSILGKYPTKGEVTAYFIGIALMDYVIADALENKKLFLTGVILVQSWFINHNVGIGIRF